MAVSSAPVTASWTTATTSVSTSIKVPAWAKRMLVVSPASLKAATAVYCQVSFDDTTFYDIQDSFLGQPLQLFLTADLPGVFDLTYHCHGNYYSYGSDNTMYMRMRISGTAAMTATHSMIYFGG